MNIYAIRALYQFEMNRMWRTLMQSIASPVISTSLYFVVFGAAIGSRTGVRSERAAIALISGSASLGVAGVTSKPFSTPASAAYRPIHTVSSTIHFGS